MNPQDAFAIKMIIYASVSPAMVRDATVMIRTCTVYIPRARSDPIKARLLSLEPSQNSQCQLDGNVRGTEAAGNPPQLFNCNLDSLKLLPPQPQTTPAPASNYPRPSLKLPPPQPQTTPAPASNYPRPSLKLPPPQRKTLKLGDSIPSIIVTYGNIASHFLEILEK